MATDVHTPIDVMSGYRVEAASNGGWVLHERVAENGYMGRSAAFSTWTEMLDYLGRAHARPIPATAA